MMILETIAKNVLAEVYSILERTEEGYVDSGREYAHNQPSLFRIRLVLAYQKVLESLHKTMGKTFPCRRIFICR